MSNFILPSGVNIFTSNIIPQYARSNISNNTSTIVNPANIIYNTIEDSFLFKQNDSNNASALFLNMNPHPVFSIDFIQNWQFNTNRQAMRFAIFDKTNAIEVNMINDNYTTQNIFVRHTPNYTSNLAYLIYSSNVTCFQNSVNQLINITIDNESSLIFNCDGTDILNIDLSSYYISGTSNQVISFRENFTNGSFGFNYFNSIPSIQTSVKLSEININNYELFGNPIICSKNIFATTYDNLERQAPIIALSNMWSFNSNTSNITSTRGVRYGIGTSNPGHFLDVAGSNNGPVNLRVLNTASNGFVSLHMQADTTGRATIFKNSSTRTIDGPSNCMIIRCDDGDVLMNSAANTKGLFVQRNTGFCGFGGNSNPFYSLDVTGDINTSTNFKMGGSNISDSLVFSSNTCVYASNFLSNISPTSNNSFFASNTSVFASNTSVYASNILKVNGTTFGPPSVGTYGGIGEKLIVYPGTATTQPFSVGIDNNVLFLSVPDGAQIRNFVNGTVVSIQAASFFQAFNIISLFNMSASSLSGTCISDSVNSTSSTVAASLTAVKAANDKAIYASNILKVNGNSFGPPALGVSGGIGDKLIIFPGNISSYPYSVGVDASTLFLSVPFGSQIKTIFNGVVGSTQSSSLFQTGLISCTSIGANSLSGTCISDSLVTTNSGVAASLTAIKAVNDIVVGLNRKCLFGCCGFNFTIPNGYTGTVGARAAGVNVIDHQVINPSMGSTFGYQTSTGNFTIPFTGVYSIKYYLDLGIDYSINDNLSLFPVIMNTAQTTVLKNLETNTTSIWQSQVMYPVNMYQVICRTYQVSLNAGDVVAAQVTHSRPIQWNVKSFKLSIQLL